MPIRFYSINIEEKSECMTEIEGKKIFLQDDLYFSTYSCQELANNKYKNSERAERNEHIETGIFILC